MPELVEAITVDALVGTNVSDDGELALLKLAAASKEMILAFPQKMLAPLMASFRKYRDVVPKS